MSADLIFYNGTIHTIDGRYPRAEAVAVRGGKILAVGLLQDIEAFAGPATRRIDLGGRCLIPGFNDAHVHLWKVGVLLTKMVDARQASTPTIPLIVEAFRKRAVSAAPGIWLTGRGYNHVTLPEHRHLTRHDLDQASRDLPIWLIHTSAHTAVANSRALELAGITHDTPDPVGSEIERDEHGDPTGILHETAMALVNRVQPSATDAEFEAAIITAAKAYLKLGITSITDPGISPAQIEVYRRCAMEGRLPVRTNVMSLYTLDDGSRVPLPERIETDWLRVDTVKLFADGGLSAGNAALSVPYRNSTSCGYLRMPDEQMDAAVFDIHRAGLRAATHAIGDVAIEQVISAIEKASRRLASPMMHRIEHFGLPNADQLRRCAGKINIATQTVFVHALGASFLNYVPDTLMARVYPLRAMLDAGLTVALSSDAPVVPDANPLLGMAAAAKRLSEQGMVIAADQAVGAEETLPLYTITGAEIAGEGHLKGSITPGKFADLVILSGDPLKAQTLTDLRVEMTMIDGEVVYEG